MVAALTPAEQAHLAARSGRHAHILIWFTAKDRASGALHGTGFWTGADHREFVVGGRPRDYFGAGGLIQLDPVRSVIGTDVQRLNGQLHLPTPEVEMAVRGYDLRQAPVEIHRALFDPVARALIGITRRFEGWVDQIEITEATDTEQGSCRLTLVGTARAGTRTLSLKKSDESQKLRKLANGRPCRFYQYADISGAVPIKWGVK